MLKPIHYLSFIILSFISSVSLAQCPQLVWADEFDGNTLDLTKWEHQTGDGCPNLCGWGNNELEYYQPQNATVSDGTLKITAKRENVGGKPYTSSRIRTRNKGDWTYGRFEARIKLPTGKGLWPAFWMLSTDEPYGGWPQSGEIDIMEIVGHEPATTHGTLHYGNPWPQNQSTGADYKLLNGGIFNDEFHVFAIEWEQNEIRWYVDDYLYSTKTNLNLSPFRWPFDHDFHFLLNVAVGGNWPGNPDGTTVFPQIMEVDYVRVYDGNLTHIVGNRQVGNRATGQAYRINNAPDGTTFNWTVPEGATITAGQGTSGIVVDFGDTSGNVTVEITSPCETKTTNLYVKVDPPFGVDFYFINFDDEDNITFNFADGDYSSDVSNPSSTAPNESALCAKYVRDANAQFDVLIYNVSKITDASEYLDGRRKFYIDIYTDAPVGTEILLQMENDARSQPTNFPTGRHSRFQAFTSVQNQWERIELKFLDQPDNSVPHNAIDLLIFLFAPNKSTGNTFYFDNFASYAEMEATSIESHNIPNLHIYPNPTKNSFVIQLSKVNQKSTYILRDLTGRQISNGSFYGQASISMENLPKGIYVLVLDYLGRQLNYRMVRE